MSKTGKTEPSQSDNVIRFKCLADGCKSVPSRFDFCQEHYDQFKFGLINKLGKPVPDFQKKYDHYLAYQKRLGGRKVA